MNDHDCKHDAELIEDLDSLITKLDEARWGAAFLAAELKEDHPNRGCGCPLTLGERMTAEVAYEATECIGGLIDRIQRFIGNGEGAKQ